MPGHRERSAAQSPLYRRVFDYFWTFKTTDVGKSLGLGTIVAASMGSATLDIPLYYLVCMLAASVVVAFVGGLLLRPRLVMHGEIPARAVAGRPFTSRIRLTNQGWLPAYDVSVGIFPMPRPLRQVLVDGQIRRLAPGESAPAHLTVHPLRRGVHHLPELYPYTVFPFNVFRSASTPHVLHPLLVVPKFEPLEEIELPVTRRYQPGGIVMASKVGESPEYIGSREYRPGDPARAIDYRSWARLARPVVREYQEEYFCRVAVILDTYVPKWTHIPPAGHAGFEAAVSLTAAIADALTRGEHVIDIFAAGPALHVFRAGRHAASVDHVLEILAGVGPCRTEPCEALAPQLVQELASLSAVVCIFMDWNAPRQALAREMAESGCAIKVALVREGAPSLSMTPEEETEFRAVTLTPGQVHSGTLERI